MCIHAMYSSSINCDALTRLTRSGYGSLTLTITFASSIFSTAAEVTAKIYHVSPEVMVLGVALFVVGFAWGPIAFGPLSELYGRRPPLYLGFFAFAM